MSANPPATRPPAPFTVEQVRKASADIRDAALKCCDRDEYACADCMRAGKIGDMLDYLAQSLETAGWRPIADKVYVVIEHSDYEHHPIVAAFATEAAAIACIERLDAYANGAPELTAEFNDDAWDAQLDARQAYFKACPDWPSENMHGAVEFHVQHVPLPPSRPEDQKP